MVEGRRWLLIGLALIACTGEPARSSSIAPASASPELTPPTRTETVDAPASLDAAADAEPDATATEDPRPAALGPESACSGTAGCPGSDRLLWAVRFPISGQPRSHQLGRTTYTFDLPKGSKLATSADGSIACAAPHRGSIDVGGRVHKAGMTSILIVKLSPEGKRTWSGLLEDPRSMTQALRDSRGSPQHPSVGA